MVVVDSELAINSYDGVQSQLISANHVSLLKQMVKTGPN